MSQYLYSFVEVAVYMSEQVTENDRSDFSIDSTVSGFSMQSPSVTWSITRSTNSKVRSSFDVNSSPLGVQKEHNEPVRLTAREELSQGTPSEELAERIHVSMA